MKDYMSSVNSGELYLIVGCVLLFIMLFRSPEFGADVPYFYDVYLGVGEDTPEPGFMFWCKILRVLPSSAFIFTFMTYLFIMLPVIKGINSYSKDKVASLIGLMVITGILIVVSGYKKFNWIDGLKGFIPLAVFSIIVIPVDYILKADYMLYYYGNGAPILPDIAISLANLGLRFVFTMLVFFGYLGISYLFVSIYKAEGE